jgi:FHS family L-fucose permease-like MFS transporter
VFLKFSSLPNKIDLESKEPEFDKEKSTTSSVKLIDKSSAFAYPQLIMGMIAIFVYVGVEVATASNLPAYLEQHLNISTQKVAPFISLYWASLMIGRWTGAIGVFDVSKGAKQMLKFIVPYLAFAVFLLVNMIARQDVSQFYIYLIVIAVMIVADILSDNNPVKMLLIFSVAGILALIIGMLTSGIVSAYAFISVGLFCSTLWPCIFTIAVAGLGKNTNQGSSLLIMMIMGGGIVSWLQGLLSDKIGIQYSYIVGVACFAYLAFYAIKASSILKKQGIDYDSSKTLSH